MDTLEAKSNSWVHPSSLCVLCEGIITVTATSWCNNDNCGLTWGTADGWWTPRKTIFLWCQPIISQLTGVRGESWLEIPLSALCRRFCSFNLLYHDTLHIAGKDDWMRSTMDCSLEKRIAHHILKSNLEFCERVGAKGVVCEQVERRYLSCAQDVILDSCRETRAEPRAKFWIIIASNKLEEEPEEPGWGSEQL